MDEYDDLPLEEGSVATAPPQVTPTPSPTQQRPFSGVDTNLHPQSPPWTMWNWGDVRRTLAVSAPADVTEDDWEKLRKRYEDARTLAFTRNVVNSDPTLQSRPDRGRPLVQQAQLAFHAVNPLAASVADAVSGQAPPDAGDVQALRTTAAQQYLPFAGSIFEQANARRIDAARERIARGEAQGNDFADVAIEERRRREAEPHGITEQIGHGLGKALQFGGEMFLGGKVLQGLSAARGLGFLAPPAASGGGFFANAGRSLASPSAWGRGLASTAITPAMYLPTMRNVNAAFGRPEGEFNAIGLPIGLALGFVQNAIFSGMGNAAAAPGATAFRDRAGRIATDVFRGMALQQGLDVAESTADVIANRVLGHGLGIETKFGTLGRLAQAAWSGKGEDWEEAFGHLVTQGLTFAAFAGMHEMGREIPPLQQSPGQPPQSAPPGAGASPGGPRPSPSGSPPPSGGPTPRGPRRPAADTGPHMDFGNALKDYINALGRLDPRARAARSDAMWRGARDIIQTAYERGATPDAVDRQFRDQFPNGPERNLAQAHADLYRRIFDAREAAGTGPGEAPEATPESAGPQSDVRVNPRPGEPPVDVQSEPASGQNLANAHQRPPTPTFSPTDPRRLAAPVAAPVAAEASQVVQVPQNATPTRPEPQNGVQTPPSVRPGAPDAAEVVRQAQEPSRQPPIQTLAAEMGLSESQARVWWDRQMAKHAATGQFTDQRLMAVNGRTLTPSAQLAAREMMDAVTNPAAAARGERAAERTPLSPQAQAEAEAVVRDLLGELKSQNHPIAREAENALAETQRIAAEEGIPQSTINEILAEDVRRTLAGGNAVAPPADAGQTSGPAAVEGGGGPSQQLAGERPASTQGAASGGVSPELGGDRPRSRLDRMRARQRDVQVAAAPAEAPRTLRELPPEPAPKTDAEMFADAGLTEKEAKVFQLLHDGLSLQEAAVAMNWRYKGQIVTRQAVHPHAKKAAEKLLMGETVSAEMKRRGQAVLDKLRQGQGRTTAEEGVHAEAMPSEQQRIEESHAKHFDAVIAKAQAAKEAGATQAEIDAILKDPKLEKEAERVTSQFFGQIQGTRRPARSGDVGSDPAQESQPTTRSRRTAAASGTDVSSQPSPQAGRRSETPPSSEADVRMHAEPREEGRIYVGHGHESADESGHISVAEAKRVLKETGTEIEPLKWRDVGVVNREADASGDVRPVFELEVQEVSKDGRFRIDEIIDFELHFEDGYTGPTYRLLENKKEGASRIETASESAEDLSEIARSQDIKDLRQRANGVIVQEVWDAMAGRFDMHAGRGGKAAPSAAPAPTSAEVRGLSEYHAALHDKAMRDLEASIKAPSRRAEFTEEVNKALANMTPEVARQLNDNVRTFRFFGTTAELGMELAKMSSKVRQAVEAGNEVGGGFRADIGMVYIDGRTEGRLAHEVYAHEFFHGIDKGGVYSATPQWRATKGEWGTLSKYATTDASEAFAEAGRQSNTHGLDKAKTPLLYEFFEKNGLLPKAKGGGEKMPEVFKDAIVEGPTHADTLLPEVQMHAEEEFRPRTGRAKPGSKHRSGAITLPVEEVKAVWDDVKRYLSPASRGEHAQRMAGIAKEQFALAARKGQIARHALNEGRKLLEAEIVNAPDAATRLQRFLEFTNAIEKGQIATLPDSTRPIAETIRKLLDERTAELAKRNLLDTFIDDYFGHLWNDPKKTMTSDQIGAFMRARRPLAGREGFRKKRVIPTYEEGIKLGFEPKSWNPVDLALMNMTEIDKSIMGRDIFRKAQDAGMVKFVKLGDTPPEGFAQLDDKLGKSFFRAPQGMVQTGNYYMPEQAATLLNNHLSRGLVGRPAYDLVRDFGNALNTTQLGFGAFHAGFVAVDTQVSAMALALQMLSRGQVRGVGRQLMHGAVPFSSVVSRYLEGRKFMKEFYAPNSQGAEIMAMVEQAMKGGFQPVMNRTDYGLDQVKRFRKAWNDLLHGNVLKLPAVVYRGMTAAAEMFSHPLMEHLVPRIKSGVLMEMIRYEMDRIGPNASEAEQHEAIGRAVKSVEYRLGQMSYDNVFWHRLGKDIAMATIRSVGWNVGTWAEVGGGVAGAGKAARDVAAGRGLPPNTAYVIGLAISIAIMGSIYQYLATGKGPEEFKDLYFPRNGRRRRDGTEDRVSLPSYVKDVAQVVNRADEGPFRILQNTMDMAKHKVNPLISLVVEMLSNQNFQGAAISNPSDPVLRQTIDRMNHFAAAFEPFSVRQIRQEADRPERSVPAMLQGAIGMTPASGRVTQTWDEQRRREAQRKVEPTPLERLQQQRRRDAIRNATR